MDIISLIWAFTLIYYAASRPSDVITDESSDRELKLVHVVSERLTFDNRIPHDDSKLTLLFVAQTDTLIP